MPINIPKWFKNLMVVILSSVLFFITLWTKSILRKCYYQCLFITKITFTVDRSAKLTAFRSSCVCDNNLIIIIMKDCHFSCIKFYLFLLHSWDVHYKGERFSTAGIELLWSFRECKSLILRSDGSKV